MAGSSVPHTKTKQTASSQQALEDTYHPLLLLPQPNLVFAIPETGKHYMAPQTALLTCVASQTEQSLDQQSPLLMQQQQNQQCILDSKHFNRAMVRKRQLWYKKLTINSLELERLVPKSWVKIMRNGLRKVYITWKKWHRKLVLGVRGSNKKQNKGGKDTGSMRKEQSKPTRSQGFKLKLGGRERHQTGQRHRVGWSVSSPLSRPSWKD